MKIVIDINENEYIGIKSFPNANTSYPWTLHLYDAVRNGIPLPKALGKCDRCGGEIYPNTLCIECNDYLAKSVFAEEIKQEIEQAMGDFYYSEHDLGVRQGFRFALEIIDKHIGKEQE